MEEKTLGAELVMETPMSALSAMEKAHIDIQISTAHAYPRSIDRFKNNAIAIATIDEDTAASCLYRRPVGKENGREVYAEGMSVRMAEIVGSQYGNLRVSSHIVEQTPRQIVAEGVAHDLETNFAAKSQVVEVTVDRKGNPYSERMRVVIVKAALAKARRDATFMVVPKALAKPIEAAVKGLLFGNQKSLSARRENIAKWINTLGIDKGRVFAALGVVGLDDIGPGECETLTGLKTALVDKDLSIDEAFPPIEPASRFERAAEPLLPDPPKTEQKPAIKTADIPTGTEHSELMEKAGMALSEAGLTMADADKWAKENGSNAFKELPMVTLRSCVKNPAGWVAMVRKAGEVAQ
jgi:hypothetical protein